MVPHLLCIVSCSSYALTYVTAKSGHFEHKLSRQLSLFNEIPCDFQIRQSLMLIFIAVYRGFCA